jgi:hypothetical protein
VEEKLLVNRLVGAAVYSLHYRLGSIFGESFKRNKKKTGSLSF